MHNNLEEQTAQDIVALRELINDIDKEGLRSIENLWEMVDELKGRLVLLEERESNRIRIRKARNIIRTIKNGGKI